MLIRPLVIVHTTDRNILDLLRGLLHDCLQTRVNIDQGVVLSMRYVAQSLGSGQKKMSPYTALKIAHYATISMRREGPQARARARAGRSLAHRQSGNRRLRLL